MKGYFFSQIPLGDIGPRNKVKNQINAFEKNGISLKLVESPFQQTGIIRGNFYLRQIVSRLPYTYVYSKHVYKEEYKNADIYYVRFLAGDKQFIRFLKGLRDNNPKAIIIMELADYPTTWYMSVSLFYKFIYFPIYLKDIMAGKQYKKYIDRIVVPLPIKEAYGIPVISFQNGIDIDSITKRIPQERQKISIIGVAGMCNFHGYDRLIEGLNEYYNSGGKRKIEIHFVGGKDEPGNELTTYKELVEKYKLKDSIFFYGKKMGKELDDIYNKCNLAVASLGLYRIGYNMVGSLKTREYLAKGLPMITGCKVDILDKAEFEYFLEFSNDSSHIDINKIIEFYDEVYRQNDFEKINQSIREYALKKCDMEVTMKSVIDYILEKEN